MKSTRIIIVMPDPPLPFGNAAARWFHVLLRGLVDRGHRVTAFAACGSPADIAQTSAAFPAPKFDVRCFPYQPTTGLRAKWRSVRQPYSYVYSPAMRDALQQELARGFDVLHLEQLWSGWLGLRNVDKAIVNIHYLFSIDLDQTAATSAGERFRRVNAKRAERTLLRRYPNITTLSPRLTETVQRTSPASHVHTVPLGLDLSLYPYIETYRERSAPVLSLIGSFNWQPTYSAGERLMTRLWPQIKARVPQAQLQFVGRCARQRFGKYESQPDFKLFEDVPDTQPYFLNTDVLLYAPSAGSGMKVKVLEAFALGTPVVTNVDGVEGIPAVDGVHAGVAEDDAGLIERAVGLLQSPEQRIAQRRAAHQLLESHCGPDVTLDRLESVYATLGV